MRNVWMLALPLLLCAMDSALTQPLSGIVTDAATGQPLESANVVLQPGSHGAATGMSGRYVIENVPQGDYRLTVTYIGYTAHEQSVSITGRPVSLDVKLEPTALPGPRIEISAMRAKERFSPVTFSDITARELDEKYFVQDIPVLLADLPSVTFYSESGNGIGYNYLRLRGFDQRRLAIMINGVPQNDPEDHNVYWSNFADLLGSTEEIQVQRGAGSAFYGPPAIGGSINIITGDFANRKGVKISSGFGSYNTYRHALEAGSGLVDDTYVIFARLSKLHTDGYRDHSYVDKGTYYFAATRYDDAFTTRVNIYGGPIQDGLVYTGLPKFAVENKELRTANYNYWEEANGEYTYTQLRRPQEREEFNQPHYELLNEWRPSEKLSLHSTLFHVRGYGYFDYDATGWTDAGYYRLTPEFGFENAEDPRRPLIHAYVDNSQWGWLPRMTFEHDNGSLTAGIELRHHESLHYGTILWAENLPEGYDPDRRYYEYRGAKKMASAYVQEQYRLTERMNLMGSVQYAFNQYRLFDEKYVGTDFTQDYYALNPRVGLNYNMTAEWNLYTNVSYTQREPRLKNLYDAAESSGGATPEFETDANGNYDFEKPFVKPESLVNVELGAGYIRDNVSVLVNGYYMDFQNEIIKNGQLDRFGQPITGNADKTSHIGLELVARYKPMRALELGANALLARSRLESYSVFDTDDDGNPTVDDLSGNRIAGFPEQIANAQITWRDYNITASITLKYVGRQFTDNYQTDAHSVDPYTLLNGFVAYRIPQVLGLRAIELRAAVYNISDALYAASGEGNAFFVGAERNYMFDVAFEL